MKNKMTDLNDHLFAQLERLNDEDLKGDQLHAEIDRSKAMAGLASNIIGNARVVLDAHIAMAEWGNMKNVPMIGSTQEEKGKPGK